MKTEFNPELMSDLDKEALIFHALAYAERNLNDFLTSRPLKDTYYSEDDVKYLMEEYINGNLKLKEKNNDS